jgi:Protein of unknown function (DUF4236)
MGLFFRKRLGLGPLGLNISKSGIGISAGVRGLRAGLSSHGRVYTSAGLPWHRPAMRARRFVRFSARFSFSY